MFEAERFLSKCRLVTVGIGLGSNGLQHDLDEELKALIPQVLQQAGRDASSPHTGMRLKMLEMTLLLLCTSKRMDSLQGCLISSEGDLPSWKAFLMRSSKLSRLH